MAQFEQSSETRGHPEGLQSRRIWRAQRPGLPKRRTCFTPDASQAQHDALDREPSFKLSHYPRPTGVGQAQGFVGN
jgi:hypothetical protein